MRWYMLVGLWRELWKPAVINIELNMEVYSNYLNIMQVIRTSREFPSSNFKWNNRIYAVSGHLLGLKVTSKSSCRTNHAQ
jgi:hypothetical protein